MAQSALGRIWNRLVDRYDQDEDEDCCGSTIEEVPADCYGQDEEEDCCGSTIEEVPADSSESDSNSCCE